MQFVDQRVTLLAVIAGCWSCYGFSQQGVVSLEEIQVLGDRLDYSLASSPSPRLIYGNSHFQSFEPQAVGDMLKRISGVAFSGDIGEFDAPQLRGLGSQYTQVLIDGQRVPGNSSDRTVLVDRIPAELIERIELIRSPTPNMDSQGIGGTLNLILKDGASLQGTDWRLGGLYYPDLDPSVRSTAAISNGFSSDAWSYTIAANVQERLNPKTKRESVLDGEGELISISNADDFRDSSDRALRGALTYSLGDLGSLDFRMAYLDNHVDENEFIEVLDAESQSDLKGIERRNVEQDRLEFGVRFNRSFADGLNLGLSLSGSQLDDDSDEQEALLEEAIELVELRQFTSAEGEELQFNGSLSWQSTAAHMIEIGLGMSREARDARQTLLEFDEDELEDTTPGNGVFRVEETRAHAYVMDVWDISQTLTLEYGLRLEDTGLSQRGNDGKARDSQLELNPSAHLLYRPGSFGQFRASLARTLRRPSFDEIVPFTNRDTPDEDQVTVGNPGLQPEFAWGVDIGYSHLFGGNRGNIGGNLFYRKIDDKIELSRIGDDLFTPRNIGNGRTWGLELDFALPLIFIDRHEVGISGNYVWIDSKIKDPFSSQTRQFNLQPNYIANIDLYQDFPNLDLSHGLSWQKQGDAREFQTDEIKAVRYGSNLEYFVEKRLGADFIVRLSVNNILDARKREQGLLFQGLADLREGLVDEIVFEREQAEPVFFLTLRGSF
ncbi:MAG: TonB-dependent receptor [Desulfofustis sp.]|nr:TonB-dependent receptor [Desulfofustis sp.]